MARILVVDDTKNIRKMVRFALESEGHTVQLAEDGLEALALFQDGAGWDLSLVDPHMPGEQGREVIIEARRRDPNARLMMMTAFATTELATEVLTAGATDFLRKPFTADVLRDAVRAALVRPAKTGAFETPRSGSAGSNRVNFHWNGFTILPVAATADEQHGVRDGNIHQTFLVRGPSGEVARCTVLMTPHIETEMRAIANGGGVDSKYLWEKICRESLIQFLWENASMPPAVLPIYELVARQVEDIKVLSTAGDEDGWVERLDPTDGSCADSEW